VQPTENPHPTTRNSRLAVGLTVLLGIVTLGVTTGVSHWRGGPGGGPVADGGLTGWAYLWLAAGVLPLFWRKRAPLTVFALVSALVFSYYASPYPAGPSLVLVLFALITLAILRGPVLAGAAALVVFALVLAGNAVLRTGVGVLDPRWYALLAALAGMVAIGTALRNHQAVLAARRQSGRESVLRQAEEQRLAIAREVHDVVAHSLAMINVQAGVAAHVADRRPAEAKAALLAIKEASRAALVDLRATLDVLRSGEDLAPTQGLARLPDLLGSARAAGLAVTVEGEPGALPAPVDVAAFRIVQESLTNVVRHATDPAAVRIGFTRTGAELRISVRDDGQGPYPAQRGNGLRGMAERAQALGGEAGAGPADGGGFEVRVRLPISATDAAPVTEGERV
jgi:signal transduction histidine kinase